MEVFAQVGSQPRPGRLGACFLDESVFCARPGLRLWEVRLTGQIISTHQLRPALEEAAPRRVVSACDQAACLQDGGSGGGKAALGLMKLVPLVGGDVAAFSGDAVFVLQLASRRVTLWTSVHGKVRDLAAVGDELYVQCEGGALRRLLVRRPSQIVRQLRVGRSAADCARLLMSHSELTELCRTPLPLQVLRDAISELADDAPMQLELRRLAAVLRDRLTESGADVREEESSTATAASQPPQSDTPAAVTEPTASMAPTQPSDGTVEKESKQGVKLPENSDHEDASTKAENFVMEIETPHAPMTEPRQAPSGQSLTRPMVTADRSSVDPVVADSSSEAFCTASSLEDCSPPSSEKSEVPTGPEQWPSAPQLGLYGYTPGLALHPEVLDAFSDLVDDVRGVVSSGAQRLVQRLRRQPPSASPELTAARSAATDTAAAAAEGRAEWPEERQVKETTDIRSLETLGCALSTDGRQSVAAALAEPSLSDLTAAADTGQLRLSPLLRWLDAVAAVHCRLQPTSVSALKTEGSGAVYPALRQLCAEPDAFVCERSFLAPSELRQEVSRLLAKALLFLVCDGEVREELADCAVAAAPTEGTATVSSEASDVLCVLTGGSGDVSSTENGTTEMVTPVEGEMKGAPEQDEATSCNGSGKASNTANALSKSAELGTRLDSGVHVSNKTENVEKTIYVKDGTIEEILPRLKGKHNTISQDETYGSHVEESQSTVTGAENPTVATKDQEANRPAAREHGSAAAEPVELRRPDCAPTPGSPAWLAEALTRRLFYLIGAAELRAGLGRLPAGPRGRLWHLLLAGAETLVGPLSVGQELVAGAQPDWLSLARLAADLCRVDAAAAAAFCLQHGDRLAPLDALYICRHAAAPDQTAAAFSAYLTAAGADCAGLLLADAELAAAAAAALAAVWRQQAAQLQCRCGWPRAGAHRASRPAATLLRRMLAARLSVSRLSQELWSVGDFSGWLQTGAAGESESHVAAVVCQLDDALLLPTLGPLLTGGHSLLTALGAVRPGRLLGLRRSAVAGRRETTPPADGATAAGVCHQPAGPGGGAAAAADGQWRDAASADHQVRQLSVCSSVTAGAFQDRSTQV